MTAISTVPLREIVRLHYGSALKDSERDETGESTVFGSNGPVGRHREALVTHPTIVIGRKGAVGSVTFAPKGGWPIDTTFYTELIDPERTDIRYLYRALARARLDRHTITTSIPGLNRDAIYATQIPLPSRPEQHRIAAILDKADAIRRKRQQTIALTEELLRSTFVEMFGDPVTNPRAWSIIRLGDTIRAGDKINYGVVQPGSDYASGVPIVRVNDFSGMEIDPR
jgi:type I restriction enzyme S subunit